MWMMILIWSLILGSSGYTLYSLITGKSEPKFHEPRCCKCRADLRENWDGSMHCKDCGQALEAPFAVYFGAKAKPLTRKRLIIRTAMVMVYMYLIMLTMQSIPWLIGTANSVRFDWIAMLLFPCILGGSMLSNLRSGRALPAIRHPHCSKCGYDLRVNWNTAQSCPECGNELAEPKAIAFGARSSKTISRKSQIWLIGFGIALVLMSFGFMLMSHYSKLARRAAAPAPPVIAKPTPATGQGTSQTNTQSRATRQNDN